MKQKLSTLSGLILITFLAIGLAFGCKKSCPVVVPPKPTPPPSNFVLIIPTRDSFMMGSPTTEVSRNSNETIHKVVLDSFYMSKYELSVGEFKAFLNSYDTNYLLPTDPRSINDYYISGWTQKDNYPIAKVSWNAALRYCNFRSKQEGLDTCYTFDKTNGAFMSWDFTKKGYRLPTEAEWEYACRGDVVGTPFASGTNITTHQANYDGNYSYNGNPQGTNLGRTVPVDTATYFSNLFGLKHMHGNLREWCYDYYALYPSGTQTNPKGPETSIGGSRVFRGGSYIDRAEGLRSACRKDLPPGDRDDKIGLRLAKSM